jgi:hypothetical protein
MATPQEPDFPPGHPGRFDYDPNTPEAKAWMAAHCFPKGERDFPPGHPKASDTPGNTNAVQVVAGVDPAHPDNEPFTGRTAEQAAKHKAAIAQISAAAKESAPREPITAPAPPQPGDISEPSGQPGE